jgi:protein disulfide-isomerase
LHYDEVDYVTILDLSFYHKALSGGIFMKNLFTLFVVTLGLSFASQVAAAQSYSQTASNQYVDNQVHWETNYKSALQQAKQQNKPLLLLFTGTDWCKYCIMLENEVFSTQAFADKMKDKFIFVKLDFPSKFKLPPDLAQQNNSLKAKYQISGFPKVVIINSDEVKLGTAGYQAGGPANYNQILLKIIGQK